MKFKFNLTADNHFEQAGFIALVAVILLSKPGSNVRVCKAARTTQFIDQIP